MIQEIIASTSNRVCVQAATGAGKSAIIAGVCRYYHDEGKTILILSHRKEILGQLETALWEWEGLEVWPKQLEIMTVQKWGRNPTQFFPDILIVDEAHVRFTCYDQVPVNTKLIGFSATPVTSKGQKLDIYDFLIEGPQTKELIERTVLCPYEHIVIQEIVGDGTRIKNGDFDTAALGRKINPDTIDHVVKIWQEKAGPGGTICFLPTVPSAQLVVEGFERAGVKTALVTGNTKKVDREDCFFDVANGCLQVIVSVDVLIAGLDLPCLDTIVLLRPTRSISLYLQAIGRGLRTAPDKTHLRLLDFTDNRNRLGKPDALRDWQAMWDRAPDIKKSKGSDAEEETTVEDEELELDADVTFDVDKLIVGLAQQDTIDVLCDRFVQTRDPVLLNRLIAEANTEADLSKILMITGRSASTLRMERESVKLESYWDDF